MDRKKIRKFIRFAFNPSENPNGVNITAMVTIAGLTVWCICAIGEAFGYATMPTCVNNVGPLLFGMGLGRASKQTEEPEEHE